MVKSKTTSPKLKRVYDPPAAGDGTRILVDRLWPRDLWLKEIAPSDALRHRFHGNPADWTEFCAAYAAELEAPAAQAATKELREHLRKGPVTLLYASRDEAHNNAVALKAWLARPRKRREDPAS
jgi:uncharacterized protein YeaO (DUF488 family)